MVKQKHGGKRKMFRVTKRMEIAGAHYLDLPYESKCQNVHGHNWIIEITCASDELTEYGMIVDFKKIKNCIHDALDHKNINDVINKERKQIIDVLYAKDKERLIEQYIVSQEEKRDIPPYINPTAENMAWWIAREVKKVLEEENPYAFVETVRVQESEGNVAEYNIDSIGVVI